MKVLIYLFILNISLIAHDHIELKVGIQNNPPQSFLDNGVPKGFVVDLMKDFALKNRYRLVFVNDKFVPLMEKLKRGDIDLVLPLASTPQRSRYVSFTSESVMITWMNIVVPSNSSATKLADIKGRTIGYTRGAYYLERFQKILKKLNLNCSFKEYDDYSTIFLDFNNGSLDAAFIGKQSFINFMTNEGRGKKVKTIDSLFAEPLYIGIKKGDKELVEELNAYLSEGKSRVNSSFNIIHQYWYGKRFTNQGVFQRNAIWFFTLLGVIGITVFFNMLLRRKVKIGTWEIFKQKLFFQNLLKNTPLGVLIFDREFKVIEVNEGFQELFGYTVEEVKGSNLETLIHEGIKPEDGDANWDVVKDLTKNQSCFRELSLSSKGGQSLNIQLWLSTVNIEEVPEGGVAIYVDVTKLKEMEVNIARNRNIESIGILAGGIAHDFNNMLSGVIGNLSLAEKTEKPEKSKSLIVKARKAALQTAGLAKQLLTFSQGGVLVKEVIEVENLVKDSVDMLLSGSNVSYEINFPDNLYPLEVDVTQLSQVFGNIIVNAKEAMHKGHSRISVDLDNFMVEEDGGELKKGKYVKIVFSDNGVGMEPQVMENIFVPYYSTKQKGVGLGMAICYSIVRKHGGIIEVSSALGEGTVFTLLFPASDKLPKVDKQEPEAWSGKLNLLLMDDEKPVRDVFEEIVGHYGCVVDLAADSSEALELYKKSFENGTPYDIVFLDLNIVGGVGGIETLKSIRGFNSDVVAVATSGYSSCDVFSNYRKYHFTDILPKPFGTDEVLDILTRLSKGTNIK